jgi:hypothetical protein
MVFVYSILVGLRFQFQALIYMFKINIVAFSSTLLKCTCVRFIITYKHEFLKFHGDSLRFDMDGTIFE